MRRLYAERRQFFLESAQRHLGEWLDFHATESGIQVVGIFREKCSDWAVAEAALHQGINVSALSIQYRHGTEQNGLVMGFAAADAPTTEKTMHKFRAVLQSHFSPTNDPG